MAHAQAERDGVQRRLADARGRTAAQALAVESAGRLRDEAERRLSRLEGWSVARLGAALTGRREEQLATARSELALATTRLAAAEDRRARRRAGRRGPGGAARRVRRPRRPSQRRSGGPRGLAARAGPRHQRRARRAGDPGRPRPRGAARDRRGAAGRPGGRREPRRGRGTARLRARLVDLRHVLRRRADLQRHQARADGRRLVPDPPRRPRPRPPRARARRRRPAGGRRCPRRRPHQDPGHLVRQLLVRHAQSGRHPGRRATGRRRPTDGHRRRAPAPGTRSTRPAARSTRSASSGPACSKAEAPGAGVTPRTLPRHLASTRQPDVRGIW